MDRQRESTLHALGDREIVWTGGLQLALGAPLSKRTHLYTQVHKQGGRIEKRTLMTNSLLNDHLNWLHLGQGLRLETITRHSGNRRRTRGIIHELLLPFHKILYIIQV